MAVGSSVCDPTSHDHLDTVSNNEISHNQSCQVSGRPGGPGFPSFTSGVTLAALSTVEQNVAKYCG